MRFTKILCRQHIGQQFKLRWYREKHRVLQDIKTAEKVQAAGIEVVDALNLAFPPMPLDPPVKIIGMVPKPITVRDETHPLWNSRICHLLGNSNVLVHGMPQAQLLTKTLLVNGLPECVQTLADKLEIPTETDNQMKRSILNAHLYDAYQEKLAKEKHPVKLMWVFKRKLGITDQRKNRLITAKMLHFCEKMCDTKITSQRKILNDTLFVVRFEKDGNLFQFELNAETFVTSKQPMEANKNVSNFTSNELPDLFPLSCNISIEQENIYQMRNIYPIAKGGLFEHPHTIYIHYTPLDVHNIHGEPVTKDQIESRALLKAFTTAAASAQQQYGADVKKLPQPITVQSIQVHGNKFHFGTYQLNTMNLNSSDDDSNYWFSIPPMTLYEHCEYQEARPRLTNYNPNVLRHALAFYKNQ